MRLQSTLRFEGPSLGRACCAGILAETKYQIFVQCDSDLMLARRIRRDVKERGRTVEGVLDQSGYSFRTSKPNAECAHTGTYVTSNRLTTILSFQRPVMLIL